MKIKIGEVIKVEGNGLFFLAKSDAASSASITAWFGVTTGIPSS